MFPMRLMKRRIYMGCVLVALLGGFPYFVTIYGLPLRLQVVNSKSGLIAGISMFPMLGSVAVASAVGGAINSNKDRIFATLVVGSLFMLIGSATLSTVENTASVPGKMYGFEIFLGLGFGFMVSTVSLGAMLECELRNTTVAQGVVAQARVLGGSIGIAASTAILDAMQQSEFIRPVIVTPEQIATLQSSARTITHSQLHAVRQAYSDSFSEGMKVCAAASAGCTLACFLTYRKHGVDMAKRRADQLRQDGEMQRGVEEAKQGD